MTIPLDTDSGSLFNRLGLIAGTIYDQIAVLGGSATTNVGAGASWITRVASLVTYYNTAPKNSKTLEGIQAVLSSHQSSNSGPINQLKTLASNTLIEMANDDTKLSSKTVANAMALLIMQMKGASESVNASTVAAGAQTAVASPTPTGTNAIVMSIKGKYGETREYIVPEMFTFTCTGDQGTGSTLYREPFSVTSPAAVSDPFAYNWPTGSGTSKTINAVDPTQDASTQILTNGDFESFSSNTPSNWAVLVGTPGTDILAAGSGYMGSNALEFAYNAGVPLSSIAQTFNNASGTLGTLSPNTVYILNAFMKIESGLVGAGTVEIALVDGSNAIITDDAGTECKITQVAASLTTSYAKVSGSFATPKALPSTYKLRVRMSTAIATADKSVYIDNVSLTAGTELYTGGPHAAIFTGATAVVKNDAWTITTTNTWGEFQKLFQQVFDMRALAVQLPSNSGAAETIDDALILN